MSKPQDDLIGKTIGQYQIVEIIGRGGMATVYRARQASINRMVALKVLPRHFLHDPEFFERFHREVDVISHLEHPHILPIYDYGEIEGVPFIAMRYMGGGSWQNWRRRESPTVESLARPLTQIADALDYAHEQGIIHRDLKPGNILTDEHGNAYLSDFGIARVMDSNLTGSAIIGTPSYMSPEQANGIDLDGRSDIYSLGVVLFEMIAGREPYEAPTPMAMMLKHIKDPMPSVREYRPSVSAEVDSVILRATAKEPYERFASATEMSKAYGNALRGVAPETKRVYMPDVKTASLPAYHDTKAAAPATSTRPLIDTAPMIAPETLEPTQTLPTRSRGIVIGAMLLTIAILGGVVAVLLASYAAPPPPLPTLTPFPGARLVENPAFSIAVPSDWFFADESTQGRVQDVWRQRDDEAAVVLTMLDYSLEDPNDFPEAIADFETQRGDLNDRTLFDESTAPDGSIRRSYHTTEQSEEAPGQIDVFYLRRDPFLVVVEMYTAYSTGNTYVPVLQSILDSVRVRPDAQIS